MPSLGKDQPEVSQKLVSSIVNVIRLNMAEVWCLRRREVGGPEVTQS